MNEQPLLTIALHVAANEAQRHGHLRVEPEHLLYILGKFEDSQARRAVRGLNLSRGELDHAEAEIVALMQLFNLFGLNPVELRRGLRDWLRAQPRSEATPPNPIPKLSRRTRSLLDQAARMARAEGAAGPGAVHLLAAICALAGPTTAELLGRYGFRPAALSSYLGRLSGETTTDR